LSVRNTDIPIDIIFINEGSMMNNLFGNKHFRATLLLTALIATGLSADAAEKDSATITITGTVLDTTCSFDNADHPIILDPVSSSDFITAGVKNTKSVPIALTCGSDASSIRIRTSGTPADGDDKAFKNTGTAKGVSLRLIDADDNIMEPAGSSTTPTILEGTTHKGTHIFKAGYVKTGDVKSGDFSSVVSLTFDYN
jgi:type 1 fimbria pilin